MDNPFRNMSKHEKYAVILGSAGVAGYLVYHHHASTGSWNPWSAATASAASGGTIDPVTGMAYTQDNVTDPLTGQTYLAEATQYGSVATAESSVSAYGGTTGGGTGTGVSPATPQSSASVNTTVGGSVYTSNSAWSQAVQAGLSDISGSASYDGTDIGTALGAYLTGMPLTAAQASLVSTAIAEYDKPPIGNLQIILKPASAPGPVSTIAGKSVTVIMFFKVNDAIKGNDGSVQVQWNQLSGATSYQVYMEEKGTFSTDATVANEGNLPAGSHSVMVTPYPGGKGTSVKFTVKKGLS